MLSVVNAVKDMERLRQITMVLLRHGFGELVTRTDLGALVPGRARAYGGRRDTVGPAQGCVPESNGPEFVSGAGCARVGTAEARSVQTPAPPGRSPTRAPRRSVGLWSCGDGEAPPQGATGP